MRRFQYYWTKLWYCRGDKTKARYIRDNSCCASAPHRVRQHGRANLCEGHPVGAGAFFFCAPFLCSLLYILCLILMGVVCGIVRGIRAFKSSRKHIALSLVRDPVSLIYILASKLAHINCSQLSIPGLHESYLESLYDQWKHHQDSSLFFPNEATPLVLGIAWAFLLR